LRDNEKEKIAELFSGRAFADFQFSPDGLYLALVAENNEILVFNFKEEITAAVDSPEKPIRKIAWLDGLPHYIVIQKGNSVSVKDVFGQTTFNEYPIIEEISRFESSGKTIYALTIGQTLLKIEF